MLLLLLVLACLALTFARRFGNAPTLAVAMSLEGEQNLWIRGGRKSEGDDDSVIHVSSVASFDKILGDAGDKLVVIDFSASWCGPCKMIAPAYDELAESGDYPGAIFLKIDVDELPEISEKYQVMAMPTFLFVKRAKVIDRFSGASIDRLRNLLQQHQ